MNKFNFYEIVKVVSANPDLSEVNVDILRSLKAVDSSGEALMPQRENVFGRIDVAVV